MQHQLEERGKHKRLEKLVKPRQVTIQNATSKVK